MNADMPERMNEIPPGPEEAAYGQFRAALDEENRLFSETKRAARVGPIRRVEDLRTLKDLESRLDAANAARREAYDAWVHSFRDLDAA